VYHVINRGNARIEVFHKEDDYAAFGKLMLDAHERLPMRLTGYCLMPNNTSIYCCGPTLTET
jgi:putative transposase